ncbi:MAG: hypothetical protein Q8O00_02605 [Holophaga sp.]|nr:hypothetical protein [Holophaga sp.]
MTEGYKKAFRVLVLVTVGLPYWIIRGLWLLLQKVWTVVVIHRGLQIVLSFLLFVLGVLVWQFGPLVTGRLSLLNAAEILAQQSEGRSTLEMESSLRRKAFRLGFRKAIVQKDAVSIERTSDNGITVCSIKFEFQREVSLLGLWRLQVPVSGKVEEPVEPPDEKRGLTPLDLVF